MAWIAAGMHWIGSFGPPDGWNPVEQLKNVPTVDVSTYRESEDRFLALVENAIRPASPEVRAAFEELRAACPYSSIVSYFASQETILEDKPGNRTRIWIMRRNDLGTLLRIVRHLAHTHQAAPLIRRALEIDPAHERALALAILTVCQGEHEGRELVRASYETLARRETRSALSAFALLFETAPRDLSDDALKWANELLVHLPDNRHALNAKVVAYVQMGNIAAAIETAQRIVALEEKSGQRIYTYPYADILSRLQSGEGLRETERGFIYDRGLFALSAFDPPYLGANS
jgi:tetratricopeptide (TPR) repeat protein